jgi:hypothetical protein
MAWPWTTTMATTSTTHGNPNDATTQQNQHQPHRRVTTDVSTVTIPPWNYTPIDDNERMKARDEQREGSRGSKCISSPGTFFFYNF